MDQLLLLLQSYSQTSQLATQALQATLRELWRTLQAPNSYPLVKTLAGQSLDALEEAQELARENAEAYWELAWDLMNQEDPKIPYNPTSTPAYPRTVENPLDVWTRPAEQYRYHVSQGLPEEQAVEKMLERVDQLAKDDMVTTKRAEDHKVLKHAGVKRYRRVIHPELSETGTCGLCLAASTRVYTINNLLPIHNNCNCETLPVFGKFDPGELFNLDDLNKLYELAGGTAGSLLQDVKYRIDEHGELGPYLYRKNKKKPNQATKPTNASLNEEAKRKAMLEAQLKTYSVTIPQLIEDVKTDPTKQGALDWQQNRVSKIRKELGIG